MMTIPNSSFRLKSNTCDVNTRTIRNVFKCSCRINSYWLTVEVSKKHETFAVENSAEKKVIQNQSVEIFNFQQLSENWSTMLMLP